MTIAITLWITLIAFWLYHTLRGEDVAHTLIGIVVAWLSLIIYAYATF